MQAKLELANLASEMMALESETFEIKDYTEANGNMLGSSTSCDSSSCSSATTSTTSCCTA
jgi:hypothetical protein